MQRVAVHRGMFGILISCLLIAPVLLLAGDLKPEEVVTRHLQSLGPAEAHLWREVTRC